MASVTSSPASFTMKPSGNGRPSSAATCALPTADVLVLMSIVITRWSSIGALKESGFGGRRLTPLPNGATKRLPPFKTIKPRQPWRAARKLWAPKRPLWLASRTAISASVRSRASSMARRVACSAAMMPKPRDTSQTSLLGSARSG